MVEFVPQHLVIPGLSTTEQANKSANELIHVLRNTVPQTPFTIGERKLHAINILEKRFNTMQPEKTQTKVLPREVPTIPPPSIPITVPPLRVMTPRVPMISQEDTIEDIIQMDAVENNRKQQLKHRYPTIITQRYKKINQVDSTETTATRQQHWLMNVHEQVKATPQFIDNFLKENMIRHPRKMTQHNYFTKMAKVIIDDDMGK